MLCGGCVVSVVYVGGYTMCVVGVRGLKYSTYCITLYCTTSADLTNNITTKRRVELL